MNNPIKPLVWVASSRKDLKAMPDDVQDLFGYALYLAQIGKKHEQAKPLKGFGSASLTTPKPDLDLIHERLKEAERFARGP
jgi:phage-related protein